LTAPPPPEKLHNLCYAGIDRSKPLEEKARARNILLSVLLVAILFVLWWVFR
jgi:hypothetical protein